MGFVINANVSPKPQLADLKLISHHVQFSRRVSSPLTEAPQSSKSVGECVAGMVAERVSYSTPAELCARDDAFTQPGHLDAQGQLHVLTISQLFECEK